MLLGFRMERNEKIPCKILVKKVYFLIKLSGCITVPAQEPFFREMCTH